MNEDQAALQEFNGETRLFPLPGLVFFPHAVQPLHVFEQRYRQLMEDTVAGDRLITLVMLKEGWENDYDEAPAIERVACLGRVIAEQLLPDGRYNLMLRGLARVKILDEPSTTKLYRVANVKVLEDIVPDDIEELMALRTGLADLILPRVTEGQSREQLRELFKGELRLGHVCDVLSFALPIPPATKQELLEELDVPERARKLMEAFRGVVTGGKPTGAGPGKKFPPDFSAN
jgi:Lon protease-like protein